VGNIAINSGISIQNPEDLEGIFTPGPTVHPFLISLTASLETRPYHPATQSTLFEVLQESLT